MLANRYDPVLTWISTDSSDDDVIRLIDRNTAICDFLDGYISDEELADRLQDTGTDPYEWYKVAGTNIALWLG